MFDWLNNVKAISPSIRRKNKANPDFLEPALFPPLNIGYTY